MITIDFDKLDGLSEDTLLAATCSVCGALIWVTLKDALDGKMRHEDKKECIDNINKLGMGPAISNGQWWKALLRRILYRKG